MTPAETLTPEAQAFALLLAQARWAAYLRARQSAGQTVPPSPFDQSSGALGDRACHLQNRPAEVLLASAGPAPDGGGRSVVIDPTVQHKSQNGRGSHVALT